VSRTKKPPKNVDDEGPRESAHRKVSASADNDRESAAASVFAHSPHALRQRSRNDSSAASNSSASLEGVTPSPATSRVPRAHRTVVPDQLSSASEDERPLRSDNEFESVNGGASPSRAAHAADLNRAERAHSDGDGDDKEEDAEDDGSESTRNPFGTPSRREFFTSGSEMEMDSLANLLDANEEPPLLEPPPPKVPISRRALKLLWDWKIVVIVLLLIGGGLLALGLTAWSHFGWEAWLTIVIVLLVIVALGKDLSDPDIVLMCGVVWLMALTIITPQQALSGFANPTVFSVAMLLIVAAGVESVGALDYVTRYILRRPRNLFCAQLRLTVPIALLSAFLNNTPVVAMMIPIVQTWGRALGLKPSKLLMPLSFSSILGGTLTLIGTSTNLVVEGLAKEADPTLNLSLFEIAMVGAPQLVAGLIYIYLFSRCLLPVRESTQEKYKRNPRNYVVACRVKPRSVMVGSTIADAGLRHLPGLYLVEIEREDGEVIAAPSGTHILHANDVLFFAGVVESIRDVLRMEGLVPDTEQHAKLYGSHSRSRILVEVVVAMHSPVVGKTVKEARFRSRYNAAILAVHRFGHRIRQKIGEIVLQGGDVLLLATIPSFVQQHRSDHHFALVSIVEDSTSQSRSLPKLLFAVAVTLAMVIVNAGGWMSLAAASGLTAYAMVVSKIIKVSTARRVIKPSVVGTIAAAFGLAAALEVTGVAETIGRNLVDIFEPLGELGVLFALYIVTAALSAVISNAAAVALMFPIGWEAVGQGVVSPKALVYVLMLAASASFSTPIGYQTNLMVAGPGGYKFLDFLRFGGPLQVMCCVIAVLLCWVIWGGDTGTGSGSGSNMNMTMGNDTMEMNDAMMNPLMLLRI